MIGKHRLRLCNLALKTKCAATACVSILSVVGAQAQTIGGYAEQAPKVSYPSEFSHSSLGHLANLPDSGIMFESHGVRNYWTTALAISAAVSIFGLATHDDNVTFIGLGCVLVSGVEVIQADFRFNLFDRGLDMVRSGPVSFGIDPLRLTAESSGTAHCQPGFYVKASYRF